MNNNPYQAPVCVVECEPSVTSPDRQDVAQSDYLRYRFAAVCLLATMVLFFILVCETMWRDSMQVEAAIASIMPLTILAVICKLLTQKTAVDAELTLQRYRIVCSAMRVLCLRIGPLMFGVGLAQLIWVLPSWQIFPWPLFVCGPVSFGCGLLWPKVEEPI